MTSQRTSSSSVPLHTLVLALARSASDGTSVTDSEPGPRMGLPVQNTDGVAFSSSS